MSLISRRRGAWLLLGLALLWAQADRVPAQVGVKTPGPGDVPQPLVGDIGLAGDPRPDSARFLNVRSVDSSSLSPDGQRLAFVTRTTGQPQLWVVDVAGGAPWQVTFRENSVTFQDWSPAGEWIAYGTDQNGNEREGFYLVSPDGLQERALLASTDAFRRWGGWSPTGRQIAFASTERNKVDFDIYVMDVGADGSHGAPRRVHEGKGVVYVAGWRPDGRALLLTPKRGEADNDVYLLDLTSSELKRIFQPSNAANYSSFAWTPDARGFYVVTNQDRDLSGLAHYNAMDGRLRWIETPTAEVEHAALSSDGRYLAWTVNDNGYSLLHVLDLRRNLRVTPNPALPRGMYSFDRIRFAAKSPVLRVDVGNPRIAGDEWILDAQSGATRRATTSATGGLDPGRFVVPDAVSFTSWDGETVHGLLYLPPALPQRVSPPVLLAIHGGPNYQARPIYDPAFQYLLSRGIAVFDLNVRGSTGYGQRFTRLDNGRLRPNAVKDIAAAVGWLAATAKVDASNVAVMGHSYGGYMTLAALTGFPDKFKAGVVFSGVSNWVTSLEGAQPQVKSSDRIEYGDIHDPQDRQFFVELSPITHVKKVRVPLMVLHGANDARVSVSEADQVVSAIRAQGGEVEYLRFPDEGHDIRYGGKLSNRIIAYRRVAAFLERTLGRGTARQ
jgi:dipeptidyl aminopeptidase/acylaminoacyl peptidase